jgi:hypothetical protein
MIKHPLLLLSAGCGIGLTTASWRGLPGDSAVSDDDGEGAFGTFFEERAVGFVVLVEAVGVEELQIAGAENLEAVVEVCAGGEVLRAKAGAGVIDFDELDGVGSAVADRRSDVGGVAAGRCDEAGEECEAHERQEYQAGRAVW